MKKKTVGYASIHIIEKLNRKSCLIEDVVIQKSERGKGIGKKLIEFLIDFSKLKKCDKIILNSNESNIPFYEKLGFFKSEIQMIIRN
jgi:glucosamine-phosphate N-acetyltransferase